ncbi:MAG: ATP-dependent helicase [Acidiferrobacterales bacterium]
MSSAAGAIDTGLDDSQRAAVLLNGHALVIAGPGSGKTRVLAARATHLLSLPPGGGKLAAVAFTRDAAREITSRIRAPKESVIAGTFHSLALKQMRAAGKIPRIVSESGRLHYILQAREASGQPGMPIEEATRIIDAYKATMAPPPSEGPGGRLFASYVKLLTHAGLSDFGDLIIEAVRGMQAGTIAPLPVRWMLVDEAQDLDDVQYAWLSAHINARVAVTLVADDDQSIYGWRHALGYRGLERFAKQFGASRAILTRNYRCGATITQSALRLIGHNHERFDKPIHAARRESGQIEIFASSSRLDDALALSKRIAAAPKGWAVLARTNRLLDLPEVFLGGLNVPLVRLGGDSFWDRPAAAAVSEALDAVEDAANEERSWHGWSRLLSLAGVPPSALAATGHIPLAVLRDEPPAEHFQPKSAELRAARSLAGLAGEWAAMEGAGRTNLVLNALARWVDNHAHGRDADIARTAIAALARRPGRMRARIAAARHAAAHRSEKRDPDAVVLATMHAAKGLEWDNVWIIGCEEGVLPHSDGEPDEERRLFYVGLTRTRLLLVLSRVTEESSPSRFLREAGVL